MKDKGKKSQGKGTTPSFEEDRENFVKSIQSKSRRIDRGAATHTEIAEWLANRLHEFDLIKRFGELEKNEGRKVPPCFPIRCDLLKGEMRRLSHALAAKPKRTSLASLVMEMLSLHVGRLSLDGYSDVDLYAEEMERKIQERELDWKKRHLEDDRVTSVLRRVPGVWKRFNEPVRNCYCRQCMNRRP